jgi:hypothetical protein
MNYSRHKQTLWMLAFCLMLTVAISPALAVTQAGLSDTSSSETKKPKKKAKKDKAAADDKAAAGDTASKTTKKSKKSKKAEASEAKAADTSAPVESGKKSRKSNKATTAADSSAAASTSPSNKPAASSAPAGSSSPSSSSNMALASEAPKKTKTTASGAAASPEIAAAQASGKVWVNLDSGIYHKGGRWYGKTKNGKFMTEAEAKAAGYKESQK